MNENESRWQALPVMAEWFGADAPASDLLTFLELNDFSVVSNNHQAEVVQVGAWRARIDIGIAHIVRHLWTLGIPTVTSCQGQAGGMVVAHGYVAFPWVGSAVPSVAQLVHAQLGELMTTMTVDAPIQTGRVDSVVRWHPHQTPLLHMAVLELTWPRSLVWNNCVPNVADYYGSA